MASTYLTRTGSTGDRKTLTISYWLKRGNITTSSSQGVLNAGILSNGDNHSFCGFQFSTDTAIIQTTTGGSNVMSLQSNALFRDTSAWYHFVWKVDTTQATESNRITLYVNGVQHSLTGTYPSQNQDTWINYADTHTVGTRFTNYFDGSLAHFHLIDGTAYDASTFGETDSTTGIWKPKTAPSVTYGTNGFFLKFENSGSMGTDSSGNANNLTVNGTMTQTIDTPANVFATLNPLDNDSATTFSNGNCKAVTDNSLRKPFYSTLAVSSGKYYWEIKMIDIDSSFFLAGISGSYSSINDVLGYELYDYGYRKFNGAVRNNDSDTSYGSSFADGDIIGVGLDLDNNKLYFAKNGTWENSADPSAGTGGFSITDASDTVKGSYTPSGSDFSTGSGATVEFNFGNGYFGTTAVSSAQNPDDGIGIFEYDVPTGYRALCTKSINAEEYS